MPLRCRCYAARYFTIRFFFFTDATRFDRRSHCCLLIAFTPLPRFSPLDVFHYYVSRHFAPMLPDATMLSLLPALMPRRALRLITRAITLFF